MKTGLFLALLVLLASTNVFGQTTDDRKDNLDSTVTDEPLTTNEKTKSGTTIEREETKSTSSRREKITTGRDNNKSNTLQNNETKSDTFRGDDTKSETDRVEVTTPFSTTTTTERAETKTDALQVDNVKSDKLQRDDMRSDKLQRDDMRSDKLQRDDIKSNQVSRKKVTTKKVTDIHEEETTHDGDKKHDSEEHVTFGTTKTDDSVEHKEVTDKEHDDSTEVDSKVVKTKTKVTKITTGSKVDADFGRVSEKTVHVSGNILLVKYQSSTVGSVQYDLNGARLVHGSRPLAESHSLFARDFLARGSHIMLYVSTLKTTDPKLAFAKFPIKYTTDSFPIPFDIDIDLPDKQLGLLERADITLYFYVYVTNVLQRMDTFLPAGTSQILLQGTNRLVQKLDVYVRPSGIELSGLFRGRFGEKYIESGTSFQILIVSEKFIGDRKFTSKDAVAQLTITDVPAMFPVPFSLLVHHQMLEVNVKYYAFAYIFENGVRRLINMNPILVINEQKMLITPQLIFTVVPYPLMITGYVTRSMPNNFVLQPNSTLVLHFHEIGSDSEDIVFKLPELVTLPQLFQVNVTRAPTFNPMKNYEIRAFIKDGFGIIYMGSLHAIPLLDEFSKLSIPVDDLLYYSQVHLHASSNQFLSYIPGSSAQIFVTETPETPTKPIAVMHFDKLTADFRDFTIQVPSTAIQRGRNYYLVMMIEVNGIITHVSKILFISNNQPPPLVVQLPVLSLNLIRGVIFDVENRPAQWSSSSYANLFLLDDTISDIEKAVVQTWKIHLENDFPIRFEVQIDFGRLHADRIYRFQSAIENGRNVLEYKPAGSVLVLNPQSGFLSDLRIPVRNFKTFQLVKGLVYINDVTGPLPEKSEIVIQLSSSPLLTNPSIVDEIRIKVDGHNLPIDFTMNLPLNKIDINAVYYFLVRYTVHDTIIIPASQAFAFSPRNEATIVLTLSKTPQIPITGQVTSTGSPLSLPADSTLHLYITDNPNHEKSLIFSEVFLQSSSNSLYEFTMNIDSIILQKKVPLYLHADIIYRDEIILSIPRPALLQITPGGEWNINLVIDLPTLLIGQITSVSTHETIEGEFDVHVEIFERTTTKVVDTIRLRLSADLPQKFRVEINNELFIKYQALQVRAVVKNCKNQILFESGGSVSIHTGLNLLVDLPVVLTDRKKLTELSITSNKGASLYVGEWRLSVTGVVTDTKTGELIKRDA